MTQPSPTSKTCTKCGATKPLDDFHAHKRSKDGLRPWCKGCVSAYSRSHYEANREKRSDQAKAWYEANKERRNEQQRAYHAANREAAAEYQRAYVAARPGMRARLVREWRAANPERARESERAWREANRERINERSREQYAANPLKFIDEAHRRRARIREVTVGEIDYQALWTGLCGICGGEMDYDLRHPDPLSKSIDHIIPLALDGPHEQANLQYAHLRCNVAKGARLPDVAEPQGGWAASQQGMSA
ncbi:hypothetical protein GCM10027600_43220 [Nocardioides ginsengisegetis]